MPRLTATRRALLERQGEAMQNLMAYAVLFQDAVARSGGLNGSDLQAVGLLMREGPATPGELAERTGLTAGGAVTAMIDRLERAGYVTRARDPHDRRRVLVTAVPETVMSRVGDAYAGVTERWSEVLATLSDDQLEFANELFAKVAEVNRAEVERLRMAR